MILDIAWKEDSIPFERREPLAVLLNQAVKEGIRLSGGSDNSEVSLMLVDDQLIRTLNLEYRGIDCPTDVLSFALQEEMEEEPESLFKDDMLGDVIISVPRARAQAEEYGHTFERELVYLAVHGTLHLLGYNHEEETDKHEMRQKEEEVMALLSLTK